MLCTAESLASPVCLHDAHVSPRHYPTPCFTHNATPACCPHACLPACLLQLSERAARAQLATEQGAADEQRAKAKELAEALSTVRDELATSRAVNQQLMLKKEDVEWQLMAAIARVRGLRRGKRSESALMSFFGVILLGL